jgi:hypothetical protein
MELNSTIKPHDHFSASQKIKFFTQSSSRPFIEKAFLEYHKLLSYDQNGIQIS